MEKKPSDPVTHADMERWMTKIWETIGRLGFEIRLLEGCIEDRERNRVEGVVYSHAYHSVGPEMLSVLRFVKANERTNPQTHLKVVRAINEAEHALARAEATASATFQVRCRQCRRERKFEIW